MVTGYLSVIVLIPLAALAWEAHKGGLSGFWDAISSPEAVSSTNVSRTRSALPSTLKARSPLSVSIQKSSPIEKTFSRIV